MVNIILILVSITYCILYNVNNITFIFPNSNSNFSTQQYRFPSSILEPLDSNTPLDKGIIQHQKETPKNSNNQPSMNQYKSHTFHQHPQSIEYQPETQLQNPSQLPIHQHIAMTQNQFPTQQSQMSQQHQFQYKTQHRQSQQLSPPIQSSTDRCLIFSSLACSTSTTTSPQHLIQHSPTQISHQQYIIPNRSPQSSSQHIPIRHRLTNTILDSKKNDNAKYYLNLTK